MSDEFHLLPMVTPVRLKIVVFDRTNWEIIFCGWVGFLNGLCRSFRVQSW